MTQSESDAEKACSKWRTLLDLFVAFLVIGATTFGGGMAMLVNLQREIVEKRKWLSYDELLDYIAIAQCTPGIIMVNTATLLGAKKGGFAGSAIATVAVVLPSIVIITALAMVLSTVQGLQPYMSKFMVGMRIGICAVSIRTVFKLVKGYVSCIRSFLLFIFFFAIGFAPVFFGKMRFYRSAVSRFPFLGFIFSNVSSVLIVLGILLGIVIWNGTESVAEHAGAPDSTAGAEDRQRGGS